MSSEVIAAELAFTPSALMAAANFAAASVSDIAFWKCIAIKTSVTLTPIAARRPIGSWIPNPGRASSGMELCEQQGVGYIFGFGTNAVLAGIVRDDADTLCVKRATSGAEKLRGFRKFRYGAGSWNCERQFVARLEATENGLDLRYIVTSLKGGAKHLYEKVYCARGEMENFIKLHKAQLASDRTSCRDPRANQFRLILHTAAYWLMLAIRKAIPKRSVLFRAEFATLRLHLIKIAARVVEGAARIRVSLPSACPDAVLFRRLADHFTAAGP